MPRRRGDDSCTGYTPHPKYTACASAPRRMHRFHTARRAAAIAPLSSVPGVCTRCVRVAPSTVLLARGTRSCPWVLPLPLIPLPPTRPSAASPTGPCSHTPLLARVVCGLRPGRIPPLSHPCRRRALTLTSTPRPPSFRYLRSPTLKRKTVSASCGLVLCAEGHLVEQRKGN